MNSDSIWHTPIKAYSDYLKVIETVNPVEIVRDDKYKKVYETRVVAVLCFALFQASGEPWYMQLRKSEITDAFIMRQASKEPGNLEILGIEVTSYFVRGANKPQDSVLEQLKKTKMFDNYHKYTDHDVVLVDLGMYYQPDFSAIHEYMKSIKAPYQIWFMQEIEQSNPDTILRLTLCNKEHIASLRLDIGEAWNNMKQKKIRGAVRTQRVASLDKVRSTKTEPIRESPWETMV